MRHPRSIRARLITFYAAASALVFLGFGGYTYWGFKDYLLRSLQQTLLRRAHQIAETILTAMPQKGAAYVDSEIAARYAPELNERVIRITDAAGTAVYRSSNARVLSPPPAGLLAGDVTETAPMPREERPADGPRYQVVAIGYRLANGARYVVEVGAPENDIFSALHGLLKTLALGFPVFLVLTSGGAYMLVGRALRPVDEIVRSAEQISLRNLSQRLPTHSTGDEVERLSLALNRMIGRLDEAYQLASRFTGDASHELRTPLTIMRGELEALLEEGRLSEDQAAQVGSVLEEAERLTQIVEGLLLISRLEAGEPGLEQEAVDLGELVASTTEQMTLLAEDKGQALHCHTESAVRVRANPVRLKQVVVNLLDNAIKYTPAAGRIDVRVAADGPGALLEIRDNGIGISTEALPHVFERFYRSPQTEARRLGGTGLGLSMVQSIVEIHGGAIAVESSEGRGATFRVRLPRIEGAAARKENFHRAG